MLVAIFFWVVVMFARLGVQLLFHVGPHSLDGQQDGDASPYDVAVIDVQVQGPRLEFPENDVPDIDR